MKRLCTLASVAFVFSISGIAAELTAEIPKDDAAFIAKAGYDRCSSSHWLEGHLRSCWGWLQADADPARDKWVDLHRRHRRLTLVRLLASGRRSSNGLRPAFLMLL